MLHGHTTVLRLPHWVVVSDNVCRSKVRLTLSFLDRVLTPYRYEYLWEDGVKYKRPTKLPAPEYVDALMNWAQNLLEDEAVFPNKIAHLNTSYRHFFLFINEFDLVDKKELAPLDELNNAILAEDKTR
ncbi:hypothetical protein HHX47_DHR5000421 [Lentinula edodes]|nr:hypothetical protein HHX47_DHR5000421 [Lentinula edodes]